MKFWSQNWRIWSPPCTPNPLLLRQNPGLENFQYSWVKYFLGTLSTVQWHTLNAVFLSAALSDQHRLKVWAIRQKRPECSLKASQNFHILTFMCFGNQSKISKTNGPAWGPMWTQHFCGACTIISTAVFKHGHCFEPSEFNFHIWDANHPVKSEAKMAAHGGQFWTSVSVPCSGLYVSFSLLRDLLLFSEEFSFKIHTKYFFKRQKRA